MAKDPYRYFRVEARELLDGLVSVALSLDKGAQGPEPVARALRLAHTLKGAARVVKQPGIATTAHEIEELLEPHRDGSGRPRVDKLLAMTDAIAAALETLGEDGAASAKPKSAATGEAAPFQTVRVELGEMDALMQDVAETNVQLQALRKMIARLDERVARTLHNSVEQVERELLQVRDTADRLRLVPASALLVGLERAARDAAESLGRRVELRASGGDLRVDAHVLAKLSEALLHLVRNAVAHGIEAPLERAAAKKPPVGIVTVAVERRGGRAVFTCRDDGRGIDVDAVRAAIVRRGLVAPDAAPALGLDDIVQVLLRGGVSTTPVADATSGRGVGLDAVRAVMAEIGGDVGVKSTRGAGTTVTLSVALSLASVRALQVEAAGAIVSLPLAAVKRVIRVDREAVATSDRRASIDFEGQPIPLVPLWQALRRTRPPENGRFSTAVVLASDELVTAVQIEKLYGAVEVVARPLPQATPDPLVTGASFDGDGNPCLLLDPAGLAHAARHEQPAPAATHTRPPVLVVDDSLTTRMLEQSILESAGYEVEVATSAEEALERAHERHYGLFLVDVEMPGMDGFEFVTRTRADPALQKTPAILVTSRNAPEDRKRGAEAGAHAYVVKGEFDQRALLDTIRGLIG